MVRIFVVVAILCPSLVFAQGKFKAGDYRVTAQASHRGTQLTFAGRVETGKRCEVLNLTGYLQNSRGERKIRRAVVIDVGGVGRLFESPSVRVERLKQAWEVYRVDAVCTGS